MGSAASCCCFPTRPMPTGRAIVAIRTSTTRGTSRGKTAIALHSSYVRCLVQRQSFLRRPDLWRWIGRSTSLVPRPKWGSRLYLFTAGCPISSYVIRDLPTFFRSHRLAATTVRHHDVAAAIFALQLLQVRNCNVKLPLLDLQLSNCFFKVHDVNSHA